MSILSDKILKVLNKNVWNNCFYHDNINNEVVISFKTSNKKLKDRILKNMYDYDKIKYVRGVVEIKTLKNNDFGFNEYKVYFKENNVSFKEYFNMMDLFESNDFSIRFENKFNMNIFYSY